MYPEGPGDPSIVHALLLKSVDGPEQPTPLLSRALFRGLAVKTEVGVSLWRRFVGDEIQNIDVLPLNRGESTSLRFFSRWSARQPVRREEQPSLLHGRTHRGDPGSLAPRPDALSHSIGRSRPRYGPPARPPVCEFICTISIQEGLISTISCLKEPSQNGFSLLKKFPLFAERWSNGAGTANIAPSQPFSEQKRRHHLRHDGYQGATSHP
jgi:hypothetical protein